MGVENESPKPKNAEKWVKTVKNGAKTGENGPRVPEAIATGGFSKKGYALV